MDELMLCMNPLRRKAGVDPCCLPFGMDAALRTRTFHRGLAAYQPTPLASLPHLARELGLGSVLVKDESRRFGLKAFKALGGSYAMGLALAERLGTPPEEASPARVASPDARRRLGQLRFVTATDGNHGRGVAWAARELGHRAEVFMPKGSASARVCAIRALGAECTVTDAGYDDTVRLASRHAEACAGILLQDTAWPGYEEAPLRIMQGYLTLALECLEQMQAAGLGLPTHLFLQAGVGSFAGALLAFFTAIAGEAPVACTVEPHAASCHYLSFKEGDGLPHASAGPLDTIMAGLACAEPNPLSWQILKSHAAGALSLGEGVAANGMRLLAAPLSGDPAVVSGESGASAMGALEYLMTRESMAGNRALLGLGPASRVLVVSTEGDTNPAMYRDVVRYGRFACL